MRDVAANDLAQVNRMHKLKSLHLSCISCKGKLQVDNRSAANYTCVECKYEYLLDSECSLIIEELSTQDLSNSIDKLKHKFKRFDAFYHLLISIISPVYPSVNFKVSKWIKEQHSNGKLVMNFGSGNSKLGDNVVNFDFLSYPNVDVVCNLERIPLDDSSVDAAISIAVLEHVPNPQKHVSEIQRVLATGGHLYCFIPFMQGFHASPWDYQRFTGSGIKHLFGNFEIVRIFAIGPTSGLLWVFQEWFALVLSFGSKRLHFIFWTLLMLLTWPLKFLDALLEHHPQSENIASGFLILVRKP